VGDRVLDGIPSCTCNEVDKEERKKDDVVMKRKERGRVG